MFSTKFKAAGADAKRFTGVVMILGLQAVCAFALGFFDYDLYGLCI
jgi:hypothetical protein